MEEDITPSTSYKPPPGGFFMGGEKICINHFRHKKGAVMYRNKAGAIKFS